MWGVEPGAWPPVFDFEALEADEALAGAEHAADHAAPAKQ